MDHPGTSFWTLLLLHTIEVQTEVRVGTGAVDFEGDLGAGSILLEDFIEGHQQHAFPSSDHP